MYSCLLVSATKINNSIVAKVNKVDTITEVNITNLNESPIVRCTSVNNPLKVVCEIVYDINKNGFLINDGL